MGNSSFQDRTWAASAARMVRPIYSPRCFWIFRRVTGRHRIEYSAVHGERLAMITVAVYALIGSIVAILISIPIGIWLGRLFERDPASWRAMRNRAKNQASSIMVGDPWASATISYGTVKIIDVRQSDSGDRVLTSNAP